LITKGRQTTAFLPHYLLVEIALTLVCSSRPSSAVKIKSMVMFLATLLEFYLRRQLIFNTLKHKKYMILRFETFRTEIVNFRSPQSCAILPSKMLRRMGLVNTMSSDRTKKQQQHQQQQQQKAANQRNTFQLKILKNVRR